MSHNNIEPPIDDWRWWPTMPLLLFAGLVGPGVDPAVLAFMPTWLMVIIAAAYTLSWAVLAIAAGIGVLWALDLAGEFLEEFRARRRSGHWDMPDDMPRPLELEARPGISLCVADKVRTVEASLPSMVVSNDVRTWTLR